MGVLRPGKNTIDCPDCGHRTRRHCKSPTCTWRWCTGCKAYGHPGQRWRRHPAETR